MVRYAAHQPRIFEIIYVSLAPNSNVINYKIILFQYCRYVLV